MKSTDEKFTLSNCTVIRETDKAVLVTIEDQVDGSLQNMWLPLSQIDEIHPDHVVMSAWIAKQKGLIS